MTENRERQGVAAGADARDEAKRNQQDELEAEQESAEAMDADVPQPAGADETTEGQPS